MHEQWTRLKASGALTPWLSLDRSDANAKSMISYIVVSLLEAGADLGPLASMAETGFAGTTPEQLCTLMINGLLESGRATVLFLDDFHNVDVDEVSVLMRLLIGKAPECLKFVIGTRRAPTLGLAALRTRGELTEISPDQLRFTTEEIERLFLSCQLRPDVPYLWRKTEGWAVALRLALIRQQQNPSPHALAGFSGGSEEVAHYLLEEVLQDLPREEQEFLTRTSLTERINGDLANELTGNSDGWELLERLRRRGLPIVPLDRERVWFRYHHLLTEFLRDKLQRTASAVSIVALHAAAARWYAANGLLQESIEQAQRTGDPQLAPLLIEQSGGWRVLLQHGVSAMKAFAMLPDPLHPKFALTILGQILLKAIDTHHGEARLAFEHVRDRAKAERKLSLAADYWCVDVVLQCYEDASFDARSIRAAANSFQVDSVLPSHQVLARNLSVIGLATAGCTREAISRSNELLERNRALDMSYAELYVAIYRGIALVRVGDLRGGRDVFQHIVDAAGTRFGPASNHLANGEILLGWVALLMGDNERARTLVEPKLATLEFAEGTCDVLIAAIEVGLVLTRERGDLETLETLLELSESIARSRSWPRLRDFAACWRLRELIFSEELEEAQHVSDEVRGLLQRSATVPSDWLIQEEAGLVLARFAVETQHPESALEILIPLASRAVAREHKIRRLEFEMVRIAAISALGQAEAARVAYAQAQATARQLLIVIAQQPPRSRTILAALQSERRTAERRPAITATPREQQILESLADGLSNKETALRLSISEDTVKFHRRNLYRKLAANTRSRLLARAKELGLLQAPQ